MEIYYITHEGVLQGKKKEEEKMSWIKFLHLPLVGRILALVALVFSIY